MRTHFRCNSFATWNSHHSVYNILHIFLLLNQLRFSSIVVSNFMQNQRTIKIIIYNTRNILVRDGAQRDIIIIETNRTIKYVNGRFLIFQVTAPILLHINKQYAISLSFTKFPDASVRWIKRHCTRVKIKRLMFYNGLS